MKYVFTLLVAAILCFSTLVWALDMTYMASIKPHTTWSKQVDLPVGSVKVELTADNGPVSCSFMDTENNIEVYQANDVSRCVGTAQLTVPKHLMVKVSNQNSNAVNCRLWVHGKNK